MTPLLLSAAAACGVHLLVTASGNSGASRRKRIAASARDWLRRAGLHDVSIGEFTAAVAALSLLGTLAGYVGFGTPGPALAIGVVSASIPIGTHRARATRRAEHARAAWPRLIEEIRLQAVTMGRSIPHAVFDVGASAPEEFRHAFEDGHREWLLSTDLGRALDVVKADLADPTADIVTETLLVAHELGATDLDQRLEALAADRFDDAQHRKDARARQEAARFARRFVVLVPAGMALAGMSIGTGRDAYGSSAGQIVVLAAIMLVALCWAWASHIMRLPEPERVFSE